jgi:hypothetical protein
MKQVWRWANLKKWATCCRRPHAALYLFKRDGFNPHSAQACEQKRCAKPLTNDLAVYLRRRLLYAQFFEHLRFYQLLCGMLPAFIRLTRLATLARLSVHHYPSAFNRLLLISSRYCHIGMFGRIRPMPTPLRYTFSVGHFHEDKLLRKTLHMPVSVRQEAVAFLENFGIQLPSPGGAK